MTRKKRGIQAPSNDRSEGPSVNAERRSTLETMGLTPPLGSKKSRRPRPSSCARHQEIDQRRRVARVVVDDLEDIQAAMPDLEGLGRQLCHVPRHVHAHDEALLRRDVVDVVIQQDIEVHGPDRAGVPRMCGSGPNQCVLSSVFEY